MTPAALHAKDHEQKESTLEGKLEARANFIAATTLGGIEAQEKQGQIEQSFSDTLPVDGTSTEDARKQFEVLGFIFKMDRTAAQNQGRDEIFVGVQFPKGWRKSPTDHSMWTDLLDDKGRKRGSIFYKAAFYDRSTYIRLNRRFCVMSDYGQGTRTVYLEDACGEIQKRGATLPAPDWNDRPEAEKRDAAIKKEEKQFSDWLKKNYPDHESTVAYW